LTEMLYNDLEVYGDEKIDVCTVAPENQH